MKTTFTVGQRVYDVALIVTDNILIRVDNGELDLNKFGSYYGLRFFVKTVKMVDGMKSAERGSLVNFSLNCDPLNKFGDDPCDMIRGCLRYIKSLDISSIDPDDVPIFTLSPCVARCLSNDKENKLIESRQS